MISNLDSKILDINSAALGTPVDILMDNAGQSIADFIFEYYRESKVLFVCGSGNNGGDGFAAANHLSNVDVTVALLKSSDSIKSPESKKQFDALKCPIVNYSGLIGYDVVVDCALGTGTSGEVRSPYKEFILDCNTYEGTIISVDSPSGIGTDTAIVPNTTITFHDIKEQMTEQNSGKILIADIGIPEEAYSNIGPGDFLRYPIPKTESHKGQNGRLLIVGGGPYFGAPALSGLAALRCGADLVRIITSKTCADRIATYSPCLMLSEFKGNMLDMVDCDDIIKVSKDYDCVLIGPGLGIDDNTKCAVEELVSKIEFPIVLDADGLKAVSDLSCPIHNAILTPHKEEFNILGGGDSIEMSKQYDSVVVLKGKKDIVTYGDVQRFNTTGTSAMTVGGTGDVLAGTIAALVSKHMNLFDAACLGTYICGKAGEYAFEKKSYGLIATDVIDCIPTVLNDIPE